MPSVLAIVDPDDLTNILADLNDVSGVNNAEIGSIKTELVADPNWSGATVSLSRFNFAARSGGTTVNTLAQLTECQIPIRIRATTYDNLALGLGYISRLLANGCVMKWVPSGSANTRYADIEPSATPVLLDGHRDLNEVITLVDTQPGITLSLTRQPYFRGAELDPALNLLTNATMLLDRTAGNVTPDNWTLSSTTGLSADGVDAANEAFTVTVATTAARTWTQSTAAASVGNSQTWTFSFYAKCAVGVTNQNLIPAFQPQTSAPAANGAEITGTGVLLTSTWQRISVTGATPAGSTDRAQVIIRNNATSATAGAIYIRNAQFEQAAAATTFRIGIETMATDPASYAGRVLPVWNPGDVPSPAKLEIKPVTAAISTFNIAVVSNRQSLPGKSNLTVFPNNVVVSQFESWTPTTNTTAVVDAAASPQSGSSALQTAAGSSESVAKRASISISSAATLGFMRGRSFRVKARFKNGTLFGPGAGVDVLFKYSWGGSTSALTTVTFVNANHVAHTSFTELDLGVISIPNTAATAFYMEGWWGRDTTYTSTWDMLTFTPIDSQYTVVTATDTVPTNQYLRTLPDGSYPGGQPSVDATDGTNTVAAPSRFVVAGPVPALLLPGLNMVYIEGRRASDVTTITDTFTTRVRLTPRYFI